MSYLNFALVDESFNIHNLSYPFKAGVGGYIDSIASVIGDKFPEIYVGKTTSGQDLPFNTWANGTSIPSGKYRLFGSALAYPKDIVSSGPADLDTYISPPFVYNVVPTPREYRLSGISVFGSLLGYNSYSTTLYSPYDTIYVRLTVYAPYGIHNGDVASITLPSELTGFPGPFKIQSRSGYDIGEVFTDPVTNELQARFTTDMHAINVQGSIGLFCRLKDPQSLSLGRQFFKFTNLGVDQYRYLDFAKPDQSVPRMSCRNDGTNGWVDVDLPHSYGRWLHANISASTQSGALFNQTNVQVVESTSLDKFGNITSSRQVSSSMFSSYQEGVAVNVALYNPDPTVDTLVRTSFPLFYGNVGKGVGATATVQVFTDTHDTSFNLDCKFDSSGLVGNSFTFSGMPIFTQ